MMRPRLGWLRERVFRSALLFMLYRWRATMIDRQRLKLENRELRAALEDARAQIQLRGPSAARRVP